jgi:ATP-grasp domain, R2K clade family 3
MRGWQSITANDTMGDPTEQRGRHWVNVPQLTVMPSLSVPVGGSPIGTGRQPVLPIRVQSGDFCVTPPLPGTSEILYRGWMLSADEYGRLVAGVSGAGARLAIDRAAYFASHHLPQWYPLLADLTPETRIYPLNCDLEAELRALGWPGFFIKDYVKSLKTSTGSLITKPEQVGAVVAAMRRFRGVIEGGFCVRRIENFLPDTERRYFVLDGTPHAPTGDVPPIVHECARRLRNRFYSVDVVQRADGQQRIVEVGDGQVSDLVGWTPERFAAMLANHVNKHYPASPSASCDT